jgi:hypothetical protein
LKLLLKDGKSIDIILRELIKPAGKLHPEIYIIINSIWNKEFQQQWIHLKDLGIDGKIILGWILGKQIGKVWTGFIWLGTGRPL